MANGIPTTADISELIDQLGERIKKLSDLAGGQSVELEAFAALGAKLKDEFKRATEAGAPPLADNAKVEFDLRRQRLLTAVNGHDPAGPPAATNSLAALITQVRGRIQVIDDVVEGDSLLLTAYGDRLAVLEREVRVKLATGSPLTVAEETALKAKLAELLDAVNRSVQDGPAWAGSVMHKAYSSNWTIILLGLWGVLGTSAILWLILDRWPTAQEVVPLEEMMPLIAAVGALGGFLNCLQSLGRYIGNRQLLRSWFAYYFFFPLKGAGLALLVFFFLKSGVVKIQIGEAGANGLDTVSYALMAGLTGLFANHAIEMLGSLFAIIFKPITGKDQLSNASELKVDNLLFPPSDPFRTGRKQKTIADLANKQAGDVASKPAAGTKPAA